MRKSYVWAIGVALAAEFSALAKSSFFTAPSFRGQADTEYSGWERFTNAYNGPNYASVAGSTSDPVITQTTPGPGRFSNGP